MAHFFLDRTFELWRDNQGTKEFRTLFDRIAESLETSKELRQNVNRTFRLCYAMNKN